MSSGFQLPDPEGARRFLREFRPADQRKGEAYHRENRVVSIHEDSATGSFLAEVEGTFTYRVVLTHGEGRGWGGVCSCPLELGCKHVYAVMKELLAMDTSARVQSLSEGVVPMRSVERRPASPRSAGMQGESLARRLREALRRSLTLEETRFLRRLREVYARCLSSRSVYPSDLAELGLERSENPWTPLELWPEPPADELEFWLYVACEFRRRGIDIPAFLAPVTDLAPIEARLQEWRHAREVKTWRQRIESAAAGLPVGGVTRPRSAADLRVVFGSRGASVHWRQPGTTEFVELPGTRLRQVGAEQGRDALAWEPEADLIRRILMDYYWSNNSSKLDYALPKVPECLGKLLRFQALRERMRDERGEPLRWLEAPLRWALVPAAEARDDYRIFLAGSDGAPVSGLRCVIPGVPTLYLTDAGISAGPAPVAELLDSSTETRIPAEALESPAGVALLDSLGLGMPPRLQGRVRREALRLVLHCRLGRRDRYSAVEDLEVSALAVDEHGRTIEQWRGSGWYRDETAVDRGVGRAARRGAADVWTVYDRSALADTAALLAPLGLSVDPYRGCLRLRVTKKFPELFTQWMRSLPPGVGVELAGELKSLAGGAVAGRARLEAAEAEQDWFDLRVVLDVSDTELNAEELKLLLNAKGGYVRLPGKGWRRLEFQVTEAEDERMARIGLNPRDLTAEPRRVHALQLADEAARGLLPEAQAAAIQRRAGELKARVTPPVPAGIQAELRPYQLEGFHFLAYLATNRFGGILADDMGLGKTVQTLTWLVWLRETREARPAGQETRERASGRRALSMAERPSLVICPKSVTDNWRAEAERFAPGLRVKVWRAEDLAEVGAGFGEADLHVLNYSQLRLAAEAVVGTSWLAVILDEGQYIKNPSSQTAEVARLLRAEHRLVLTGTPIENRLLDLWSLMAFAMPGLLGNRAEFGRLFDARNDPLARRRLSARVRPFLLRRTKSQVAKDLPDRVEEDLYCELEGEQKTLYRAELKRAQQRLLGLKTQRQLDQERFHFLTSLLRLRQICCHPALVGGGREASGAKLDALLEQLEPLMEEGQKVLVFSQFVELLQLIRPALAERGWPQFLLTGETEHRGELVKAFQAAAGPAVFLISLKAGGFGLNLTAASYVILFDPWWNPAVERQAIDRTHRIGQTQKVIAYRLLIKGTVEEKIRRLQQLKGALAEDVLGEEKFAQALTLDDLRYLLAD